MGILGRILETRRRQLLVKRFGTAWGQKLFAFGLQSDAPFQLLPNGALAHAPTGLDVGPNVVGVDAVIAGSSNWLNWSPKSGLRFEVADEVLYANIDGIRLFIPQRNDFFTLAEVFREELYRFEITGEFAFMDIGANIGLTSLYLAKRYQGPVTAYELVPSTAANARRNLDLNPELSQRVTLVEAGLADREGSQTITIDSRSSASNSMYAQIGDTKVEVKFLDGASELEKVRAANPGKKLFVKLDAEGAEYDILNRWHEAGCLDKIDVLVLEWHEVDGRSVDDLRSRLREGGFEWFERAHWHEPVGFITAWGKRA